jgi:hypothetical protein|tara:strand:+ start:2130 stop:2375 length:246 start_codon:yes stop_codon:yes gene_type:complete
MKARATDNNLIWESLNQPTDVNKEDYVDMFRTNRTLPEDLENMILTIRDDVEKMGKEEDFGRNLDEYLEMIHQHVMDLRNV